MAPTKQRSQSDAEGATEGATEAATGAEATTAGAAGTDTAAGAEGTTAAEPAAPMLLTGTGEVVPNPAAGGAVEVPYDIGGLPAVRSSADSEATRKVRVFQEDGEIGLAMDGGPRTVYQVTNGTIEVPARHAARLAAAIPGARLED